MALFVIVDFWRFDTPTIKFNTRYYIVLCKLNFCDYFDVKAPNFNDRKCLCISNNEALTIVEIRQLSR